MDRPPNKDYFRRSFTYKVNRWEEWTQGRCISQGAIDLTIQSIDKGNSIKVIINGDTQELRIAKETSYDYHLSGVFEGGEELFPSIPGPAGRIRYMTSPHGIQDVQIIMELHFENSVLAYIRFAFDGSVDSEGADRIIEFYGEIVELARTDVERSPFEDALRNGSNQPPNGKMIFSSSSHIRFEADMQRGPAAKILRHIVVEKNRSGNEGYTVSIECPTQEHPFWGGNLTMSHKPMRVVGKGADTIVLRGYGFDAFGISFSDYAVSLKYEESLLSSVTLFMLDRNIKIIYHNN